MYWLNKFSRFMSGMPYRKGLTYFNQGRVRIVNGTAASVEATVRGQTQYLVGLSLEGDTVSVDCDCPYFSEWGRICKHVWAVANAAQHGGHLSGLVAVANPVIQPFDHKSANPQRQVAADRREQARKEAERQRWKQTLATLRTEIEGAYIPRERRAERRLDYWIPVADSEQRRGLILKLAARQRKASGEWGKPHIHEYQIRDIAQLDDPLDREIIAMLAGARDASYFSVDSIPTSVRIPTGLHFPVLSLLSRTGRCRLILPQEMPEEPLLEWDDGPPWELRLEVRSNETGDGYVVEGALHRDESRVPVAQARFPGPGLVLVNTTICRLSDTGASAWALLLRERPLRVPVEHRGELLSELLRFQTLPPLELPAELRVENTILDRPPYLRIHAAESKREFNYTPRLACELSFDYDGQSVADTSLDRSFHHTATASIFLRDTKGEDAARRRLYALGFRRTDPADVTSGWNLAPSKLPAAIGALVTEGWRVEADGNVYRKSTASRLEVASGIDWFELRGEIEFDGHTANFPELLKAVKHGGGAIRLDDGSFGLLPEEWLDRYKLVLNLGTMESGGLRFSRSQAGLLDALLAVRPEIQPDAAFTRVRAQLQKFHGVEPRSPGSGFKGELRAYQSEGLGWLLFLRDFGFGGCLADDMGLGKTVQVLALLDYLRERGERPSLVVVPRSLIFNWRQEAARFTPDLRVLDHTGTDRQRSAGGFTGYDLILTTYGTLRRDALMLKDVLFNTVILDEAQAIKNANTESAKAVRLLNADHRLVVTGTPVENHLGELWSLFEFLNPGMLGAAAVFRSNIDDAGMDRSLNDTGRSLLAHGLRPFILRRTKEQVARDLPEKTEQTIYCELEGDQRRLYDELRDHYRNALFTRIGRDGMAKSKIHILEALLRLRQAACHAGLVDKARVEDPSAKLEALLPQLAEVAEEGHKSLVFSQFTSLLAIVRTRLDRENIVYEYLDGRTRDREARVRRFQDDPQCKLFLISLKAGGLGLNLTAAGYVFLLDPWWNPAVEAQAIDRTHRIGQQHPVFAYRLIARDTVEDKVLELQKTKRDLADAIINSDNSLLRSINQETLELLLS